MVSSLAGAVRRNAAAMAAALPEDVKIAFELTGPGGGRWTLVRGEQEVVRVVDRDLGSVDCRLSCSVEDFERLLDGRLDGRAGFIEGRLRLEGDVSLALRLAAIVRPADAS